MKAFIVGTIFGILLTLAGIYYFDRGTIRVDVNRAGKDVNEATTNAAGRIREKVDSLNLNSTNLKDELSRTGAIIRRKASEAKSAISDAAADTRITATIKGKLALDPSLSALAISVSTTDGLVTMSGTATSPENVQKAIQIAWDTEGVTGVVSTINVK